MYLCSTTPKNLSYRPGLDRWSLYKSIWQRHWKGFCELYPERLEPEYGPLPVKKKAEVAKLLRCGDFNNGFRKHTCPDCGTVLVVPFTCKSRLCLSCYRKKLYGWSINLSQIMDTSFTPVHVAFTVPGMVTKKLFEKGFKAEEMIPRAATVYWKALRRNAGSLDSQWRVGIIATVHRCGNGLNYNPHVHLIGTRELVNTETGEIAFPGLINYRRVRFEWMNAVCALMRTQRIATRAEIQEIKREYPNGFHVYFQPITGESNDVLFRTAEYLAAGYFHNSQIVAVDHHKKTVTFRFKSWVDRNTKEKSYSTVTMDIYEFMARMLYYLPDRHRKMIRYYGLYAHKVGEKLKIIDRKTWAAAIENSFNKNPELCPDCGSTMRPSLVFSFFVEEEMKKLWRSHVLYKGYFRMKRGP